MRAIVMLEDGEVEYREDVDVRDVRANEARVRLVAAGFCGSDLSVIKYRMATKPAVLGHEGAGIVEEVGPGVTHVAAGDHVVISTIASCGHCRACATGRPVLCRASSPPP